MPLGGYRPVYRPGYYPVVIPVPVGVSYEYPWVYCDQYGPYGYGNLVYQDGYQYGRCYDYWRDRYL